MDPPDYEESIRSGPIPFQPRQDYEKQSTTSSRYCDMQGGHLLEYDTAQPPVLLSNADKKLPPTTDPERNSTLPLDDQPCSQSLAATADCYDKPPIFHPRNRDPSVSSYYVGARPISPEAYPSAFAMTPSFPPRGSPIVDLDIRPPTTVPPALPGRRRSPRSKFR